MCSFVPPPVADIGSLDAAARLTASASSSTEEGNSSRRAGSPSISAADEVTSRSSFVEAMPDGEYLPRIAQFIGIEDRPQMLHRTEVFVRVDEFHEFILLAADTVLAAQGAAGLDADPEHLVGRLKDALFLAFTAPIEQEYRVHVPVSRVKQACEGDTGAIGDFVESHDDLAQTV